MKVYLVRRIEDKGVLGVFWGTPADVWDCVDEAGDPCDFEAASIGPGGIMNMDEREPVWQQYLEFDETPEELTGPEDFQNYQPSEGMSHAIRDQETLKWKRLDAADKGVGILKRLEKVIP